MKETPESPPKSAIRCRISCCKEWCCQNQAQLPKPDKNRKKRSFRGISNKRTGRSQREFPNFCTKETPERPSRNAVRCRISCSIQRWCWNEAQLPKTERKYEKKERFHEFQLICGHTRDENFQFSARTRHVTDLRWTSIDAEFRALLSDGHRMKSGCHRQ